MRQLAAVSLAVPLSGALFALAMPPGDVQALGWVCFIPLFLALKGARFLIVCLAPIGAMLFGAYLTTTGVFYAWPRLEGEDAWHYAGYLIFGLVTLPGFVVASRPEPGGAGRLALVAATFLFGEGLLLAYLPGHLALTQYRSPAMLGLASNASVWGVSFLLWWVQLLLAFRVWEWMQKSGAPHKALLAISLAGLAAIAVREHPEPFGPMTSVGPPAPKTMRLAVFQSLDADFRKLSEWTRQAGQNGSHLVVWPELSAAGAAAGGRTDTLEKLSLEVENAAFVTTFPDDAEPMPHNAASVFWQGKESERYFKRKPFGGESSQHQPGHGSRVVSANGLYVGLLVCFDSCFPDVVGAFGKESVIHLVALPCMGPESPYGMVQAVHGAFTPFRSAEQGLPIARSETSAFAMVTDAKGRIVAQAPPGFQGVLYADLPRRRTYPLASMLLPLIHLGVFFTAPAWGLASLIRRRRSGRAQASLETTDPSMPSS